jgi:hypothetical protein
MESRVFAMQDDRVETGAKLRAGTIESKMAQVHIRTAAPSWPLHPAQYHAWFQGRVTISKHLGARRCSPIFALCQNAARR